MRSHSRSLASRASSTLLTLTATLLSLPTVDAFQWNPVSSPDLRLNDLGRVAFAGDFNGLSIYQYIGQNEATFSSNGSQSIFARLPNNGAFGTVLRSDAHIHAMCAYNTQQGQRIVVGGNFTSLNGGTEAAIAVALVDPNNGEITAMPGLEGTVNALYCDENAVYVGGAFQAANTNRSTNAITWTDNWTDMPFQGFNGPVYSIVKSSDGTIVFGGDFDGLGEGDADIQKHTQVIPLASGRITSAVTLAGSAQPQDIICQTASPSGPQWLLADRAPGFWQANFDFGFEPTRVRLYQTSQQNRGVRTWRFTALPDTGIMNLTYTDANGQTAYCDQTCPMPENNSTGQDFTFVNNNIGMNGFRIDVSDWYGDGAGLAGIELFQNDIYTFAVNDFNEPRCDGVSTTQAESTVTGPWLRQPSGMSNSDYLSIRINETVTDGSSTSVVFRPNLDQSGNYTVKVYTPGCTGDGTCTSRGRVNVTGVMQSPGSPSDTTVTKEIFQTNNFDKYDEVYFGYVDATSSSFRPSITLQPANGQGVPDTGFLTVVAQRVRFELVNATTGGSLNGLFEFDPDSVFNENQISSSAINRAGQTLSTDAAITSLVVTDGDIFAAGNFSSSSYSNILRVADGNSSSLAEGGLNAGVLTIHSDGPILYVGGNFTGTRDGNTQGLSGIAIYSTSDNAWSAVGAGVNGMVQTIVPFSLNVTENSPENALAVSGAFDSVLAFDDNATSPAQGFAVWVPSRGNWLQNLDTSTILLSGFLSTFTDVPNSDRLYAGSVASQAIAASGAVELSPDPLRLSSLPLDLQTPSTTSSNSAHKRAVEINGQNITGATVGAFWIEGNNQDRVFTAVAGHFVDNRSEGSNITNLAVISPDNVVNGLTDQLSDSTFLALAHQNNLLLAGGSVSGQVNDRDIGGLIVYDLQTNALASTQPQGLLNDGDAVVVHAVVASQDTNVNDFYVGGKFDSVGGLGCSGLCIYNTQRSQWTAPQTGFNGTVSMLQWQENNVLLIGGNLTVNGNNTHLVTYNTQSRTYTSITGSESIPGAITAYATGSEDGRQFWVAGTATNGSAFLQKYDGTNWQPVGYMLGEGSYIRGIQLFTTNSNHEENNLLDRNRVVLVMGSLNVTGMVTSSSALFNGTTFTPFLLSTTAQNTPGSISFAMIQNPQNIFRSSGGRLAVGFVVLIALAVSLGLIALLVIAGVLAERWRRRRDGYMPANQNMMSGAGGGTMNRIRPQDLFGTIGKKDAGPQL